jgi:hypothetical protein
LVNLQSRRNYLAGLAANPALPASTYNNAKARAKRRASQLASGSMSAQSLLAKPAVQKKRKFP